MCNGFTVVTPATWKSNGKILYWCHGSYVVGWFVDLPW